MIQNIQAWDRWGLRIQEAVYFDNEKNLLNAIHHHNLVSKYLDEHPLEIPQLFNEKGQLQYFDVLDRAEIIYQ